MRNFMLGLVLALTVALGSFSTASAQTDVPSAALPTSSAEMTSTWRVMNPTTFPLSDAAVLDQFDRVAAVDPRLTPEKRDVLESLLAANLGLEVWVPDGIGLDYLTGRRQGRPHVYKDMEKQIGRADRALLFDLGDGISLYWFTGTRESCNNIGLVINEPVQVAQLAFVAPEPVVQYVWVMMPEEDLEVFRGQGYIPSVYLTACCNTGVCANLFIPGMLYGSSQVDSDPTMVRVRVPNPQS